MAFKNQKVYQKRAYYEKGGTFTYELPASNLLIGMNLLAKIKANIKTDTASNIPDYQIFRMISKFELIQNNKNSVWSLTGEQLALYFNETKGVQAPNNTTLAGAVADGVEAQHYLPCTFYPKDAIKPWDYGIDTRKHEYKIVITWADMTQEGVLFGTIDGTIEIPKDNSYIDIELDYLEPIQVGGFKETYLTSSPMLMRLIGNIQPVTQNSKDFNISLEKNNDYRNFILWATNTPNDNQEKGSDAVILDKIYLKDSKNNSHGTVSVDMLREETALRYQSNSLVAGFLDYNMTRFGSVQDAIKTDNVLELGMKMEVASSTGSQVHTIAVVQQLQ